MKVASNNDARLTGLFIFVLGLGAGYWFIYLPISHALNGDTIVNATTPAIGAVPIAMIFGLFLMVFGSEGHALLQKRPSGLALVLLLIAVFIVLFGCDFGMQFILKSLGYR